MEKYKDLTDIDVVNYDFNEIDKMIYSAMMITVEKVFGNYELSNDEMCLVIYSILKNTICSDNYNCFATDRGARSIIMQVGKEYLLLELLKRAIMFTSYYGIEYTITKPLFITNHSQYVVEEFIKEGDHDNINISNRITCLVDKITKQMFKSFNNSDEERFDDICFTDPIICSVKSFAYYPNIDDLHHKSNSSYGKMSDILLYNGISRRKILEIIRSVSYSLETAYFVIEEKQKNILDEKKHGKKKIR